MLGRPNLARLHCERFNLIFHILLPPAVADDVLHGTVGHETGEDGFHVFFGSTYRVGGVPHVVTTSILSHGAKDYDIHLEFIQEERSRPPRGMRSPQRLGAILAHNIPQEPVSFAIYSTFAYKVSEGWRSVMPLPAPLPMAQGRMSNLPFTHVEAVRISKRENSEVKQWIQVGVTEAGDLRHEVFLQRHRILSKTFVQQLLKEASRLSRRMVTNGKEAPNVN